MIKNVKEFKYLGILFSRSGSFCKAKNLCEHVCEQAQKAMYGVINLDCSIFQLAANSTCLINLFYQF